MSDYQQLKIRTVIRWLKGDLDRTKSFEIERTLRNSIKELESLIGVDQKSKETESKPIEQW